MPRHLFDHVDLSFGVGAEGGNGHVDHARRLRRAPEADGLEIADNLVVAEVAAENGVDPCRAHHDPGRAGDLTPDVERTDGAVVSLPRRRAEQLAQAQGGAVDSLGVTAPLEARRRLGPEVQPLGAAGDRHGREVRRLEQDAARRGRDLARRPTHDPADADRRVLARRR